MGNETSQINSLKIEEKATEITDFWSHYQATISDSCRYFGLKSDGSVSVFKGKAVLGPLWNTSMPIEKLTHNLLKYRHPYIVRYISSWQQKSTFHLVTEYVLPLSQILSAQTPLQICVGLNNILQALVFLHQQGCSSHNNISVSSIYVSGDGQWKLGGLQYLCPFNELTHAYLKHASIHRYDKAVDPNEETNKIISKVDHYGFAVLVEDVFKGHNDDDVPNLKEFKKYCRDTLQHSDPQKRLDLSEVLKHDFFNHNFIAVYKFLNVLPLKTEEEKSLFFSNILINLRSYDEETVAKQFSGLLLSRHTLLDQTARDCVLPFILKPKKGHLNGEQSGYFTMQVFKEHVKPRLLQLFGVRDNQIRMLLLSHFLKYVHVFSHEELSQHILPELLLGIKDTNDSLVASTLICLSELVPILGADTVVGGQRTKIFIDGRPKSNAGLSHGNVIPNKSSEALDPPSIFLRENITLGQTIILNERPSPVGGESTENDDQQLLMIENNTRSTSEDEWDNWDNAKHQLVLEKSDLLQELSPSITTCDASDSGPAPKDFSLLPNQLQKAAMNAKRCIIDISELDIKNKKMDFSKSEEYDFFADMTPVIEKQKVTVVSSKTPDFSSKLNFIPGEDFNGEEGWGENWED